jgi:hypothetical protein
MSNSIVFTVSDDEIANAEGWGIFSVDGDDKDLQLQKFDDSSAFQDDDAAWDFVLTKAVSGSELHQRAIAFIKQESPDEFESFVKDVTISEGDDKTKLVFYTGKYVEFPSLSEAEAAQAHYRKAVSLN